MNDDFFMYSATFLYFMCYAPSVYADFKNKNANIYNLPEKIISLCATTLGLIYSIRINNIPLIVNYGPHLVMETITILFKIQYIYHNRNEIRGITGNSIDKTDDIVNLCSGAPGTGDQDRDMPHSGRRPSASIGSPTRIVVNPIHSSLC